jgi:uncharacterized membrane protein
MAVRYSGKVRVMARTAILAAVIILMAFTPIGYLKIGVVSITFIMIPVVVGSTLISPAAGAFLGGVFGATSFIQCFGLDAFGTALFGINPFFCATMCFIPRIIAGWLPGLICRALRRVDRSHVFAYAVSSLSGSVLNTALFVASLIFFYGSSDYLKSALGTTIPAMIAALITTNALIEAAVCLVVGCAVEKALEKTLTGGAGGSAAVPSAKASDTTGKTSQDTGRQDK